MDVVTLGMAKADAASKYTSQPRKIISIMRRNQTNAVLGVLSDSSGVPPNFTDDPRWVYLLGQWLANQFPAYTVVFKAWNDTGQTYDADRVIQTGSGAHTLTIYNGAVGGQGYDYVLTGGVSRINAMFPLAPTEVIINYGYNSTVTIAGKYKAPYLSLCRFLLRFFPGVAIMCIGQAPAASAYATGAAHLLRQADIRALAQQEGYGFIDVTQAFLDKGNWDNLIMPDFLHPNAAGSQVWLTEIKKAYGLRSQVTLPATSPVLPTYRPVPAKAFDILSGAPVFAVTNAHPAWAMPNGADSALIVDMLDIPAEWVSVNVYVVWFTAATTGSASFTPRYGSLSTFYGNQSGGTVAPGAMGVTVIAASATANVMRFSIVQADTRVQVGYPMTLTLTRNGSTDSLAAAAQVVGVLFERCG